MTAGTVADIIRRNAQAFPAAPAVVGEGRAITYGELDARSSRLAAGLVAAGLRAGDRVAYLARNATEYWELFFGAAKAGVAVVPLNFRLSASELEWILGDAEPAAVLAEEHLAEEHLAGLVPAAFPGLRLVFAQDGAPRAADGWSDLEGWLVRQPPADPRREVAGDGLLTLIYSSGTTGRPKGVTTTVGAMLWAVQAFGAQFAPSRDMVSLVPTPYYHVVMVPTLIQLFITSPQASAAEYSNVRYLLYGGSPISETVMLRAQQVFGAGLAQSYGLTETIGVTTTLGPADHVAGPGSKLRSAGRAVAGIEIKIIDPDSGAASPPARSARSAPGGRR